MRDESNVGHAMEMICWKIVDEDILLKRGMPEANLYIRVLH